MRIEEQVISLELAQKLKELGVKQESLFWWDDHTELGMGHIVSYCDADNPVCAAFTAAELGKIMGIHLGEYYRPQYAEETETNFRGAMLIDLLERGIIAS